MASQPSRISIDKFGRVVLPKEIRDRMGIRNGTEFEVEETEEGIYLRPYQPQARIVKKNGFLLIDAGELEMDSDSILKTIDRVREERDRENS